mgnify:FL=1
MEVSAMRRNRKHKDKVFVMVFKRPEDLLDLYNGLNKSHYDNPDDLEITTLEDAIYIHMKNDMSFLIDNTLNLWEHQSSYNPNMPVRGLSYFAKLYQKYIDQHKINIFSTSLKPLPFPQYFVFYNGPQEAPDRKELLLSDAFKISVNGHEDSSERISRIPCLEVRATMLNINSGHNRELMESCRRLREYAQFVEKIRDYQRNGLPVETALDQAVNDCIREGVLEDLLSGHKAEVMTMFLTEYDEERHMEMEREEWEAIGITKGEAIGIAKGVRALVETCQELGHSREEAGGKLRAKFSVSADTAEAYLKSYWKNSAETRTAAEKSNT